MIPLGWDPRSMPIVREELDSDGDIIYWIDAGNEYVPIKAEILYGWDSEYARKELYAYTLGEIFRSGLPQGGKTWRRMIKYSFSFLHEGEKNGKRRLVSAKLAAGTLQEKRSISRGS